MFHFIAIMLFYKFLGSACAVGVGSNLEVHALEWLDALVTSHTSCRSGYRCHARERFGARGLEDRRFGYQICR